MGIDGPPNETNRPYAPPSNVVAVIHRLRARNLPEQIDADYLRDAGIPEGTVGRTMFALRFLRLVDYDTPTQALRSIARSTDEEYQATLAGLVRDAYRDVFDVLEPAQDPPERIENFFRRYTPASQRHRMVIFFLGMCREAGIPTLETTPQRTGAPPAPRTRAPQSSGRPAAQRGGRAGGQRALPAPAKVADNPAVAASGGPPPAIELLLRSLPPEGTPMAAGRRAQWIELARAALAFVYPEAEEGAATAQPSDGEERDEA